MKIKKLFLAGLLASTLLLSGCGNAAEGGEQGGGSENPLAGNYDVTLWVSESAGVAELTATQIRAFEAANPGIKINETVEKQSESDAATKMLTDVENGADIFCFAQDQFARLVQGGALERLGQGASNTVRTENDAGSVKAVTSGDYLYAYPMTSDNGYFMYYDKRVVPEAHVDSLEDIIADCEAAGKNFCFEMQTSAWYLASFFFGTGCVSRWTVNDDGEFTGVEDTFNSDEGLIAVKGMQKLVKSTAHLSSSKASEFAGYDDDPKAEQQAGDHTTAGVVVSGTWGYATASSILGDNLGAAKLPHFEVGGQRYQLGSYSGYKLMGVKPTADAKRSAVLSRLALYLTNAKCQEERFDTVQWGPSNLAAQALEKVQSNPGLKALAAQSPYSVAQGQIHGSWWDIAKVIGTGVHDAATGDETALRQVLADYKASIDDLFQMSPEVKRAFTIIGKITSENLNWDGDLEMVEEPANTWTSKKAINFQVGDEFKCRQGLSWTVNFGDNGNNFVITEANAGLAKVKLVLTVDGTGNITAGEITLVPAN